MIDIQYWELQNIAFLERNKLILRQILDPFFMQGILLRINEDSHFGVEDELDFIIGIIGETQKIATLQHG